MCTPTPSIWLSLLSGGIQRKRKRKAVCKADEAVPVQKKIEQRLKLERDFFLTRHPSFRMLGSSYACPDSVITHICNDARFIKSEDDITIFGIRPELKSIFVNVILEEFSKRSRCM